MATTALERREQVSTQAHKYYGSGRSLVEEGSDEAARVHRLVAVRHAHGGLQQGHFAQSLVENALAVWMRDLLGMSDDLEGVGQGAWIGRLRAPVGELRLGHKSALHNLVW